MSKQIDLEEMIEEIEAVGQGKEYKQYTAEEINQAFKKLGKTCLKSAEEINRFKEVMAKTKPKPNPKRRYNRNNFKQHKNQKQS